MTTYLAEHAEALANCRFCPMCKPVGEVSSLLQVESHTTRARAMMLWRIQAGFQEWTPRAAELLYRSTLDGISEAWCVSHQPVSAYMLAARAEVWANGWAPAAVSEAVRRLPPPAQGMEPAGYVLVAGELAEAGEPQRAERVAGALGVDGVLIAPVGATAYALGARDHALAQAEAAARVLAEAGARSVVCDGPQTLWMLRRGWTELGLQYRPTQIRSLAEAIAAGSAVTPPPGSRVWLSDSRAATFLADQLVDSVALQPGFDGPEEALGRGEVFDQLRDLIDSAGLNRLWTRWQRCLARSTGGDDGLWATYPELAERLARSTLDQAIAAAADLVVVDSPIASLQLERTRRNEDPAVTWIGDWL